MTQPKPQRLSSLDLVEALQLGHAVVTLHDLKVLASLGRPSAAGDLATKHRLNAAMLRGTLDYVAARTDLIRKTGNRFVATQGYSNEARFLLDMYAGAYGGNAMQLAKLLRKPALAPRAVDRVRHARAFGTACGWAPGVLPKIVRQLQFNYVLDLGCGPATLLLDLAAHDPGFVGWGLEVNPAMCRTARANIRAGRLGKRIRVLEGDSNRLRTTLPSSILANVRAVTASQVVNEMFGAGPAGAVAWLRGIRKVLPGRPLLISDYYGRLGVRTRRLQRETLLHDYAQLISGQGVPPVNVEEWRALYSESGCRLAHVIEDKNTTLFVHIVVL